MEIIEGNYDIAEAGESLRISRTGVFRLIAAGELTPIRIGRRTLIPRAEVARFIDERLEAARAAARESSR